MSMLANLLLMVALCNFKELQLRKPVERNYIVFYNTGNSDKPFVTFYFCTNDRVLPEIRHDMSHSKIRVTDKVYDSIAHIIETARDSGSQHISGFYYYFGIKNKGEEKVFTTIYAEPIKQIFTAVYRLFKNTPEGQSLRDRFNSTLLRLARRVAIEE